MGKLITIKPSKIKPSQDYLKENNIKFILTCFFEKKQKLLPPIPIVKYNIENNEYVAVDGHNLIAVYDLFGKKIDVYVANHPQDDLPKEIFSKSTDEGLASRKRELKEKYNKLNIESVRVMGSGISSFTDLRNKYSYLISKEKAKEFYRQNR